MDISVYQPLIVGLGAVVLATVGNTALEWFKQSHSQRRSATALRRALLEELRYVGRTYEGNVVKASGAPGQSFVIPIQQKFPVYELGLDRLGLLRPSEIASVVAAYSALQSQADVYCLMGQVKRHESGALIAYIDGDWGDILAGQAKNMGEVVSKAITELSR